ncbi:MAG: hypothetical protein K0R18_139 [Bacillales bacterium]|jgi:hypothetical protein|nr:hypothetical protein [Bacillales bacterium]
MANIYHKGDDLFLYVQFKDDKRKPIEVVNPTVCITYEQDGDIKDLLPIQNLVQMSENEYFFNYVIPYDAPYGIYQIEYQGQYNEELGGRILEEFHIIPTSEVYDNAIKVYGFVHQMMANYPLIGVTVDVSLTVDSRVISKSFTGDDGSWEVHLYPDEYTFKFSKFGFKTQIVSVQLGASYTEIQFDNVTLESEADIKKGNGIFRVSDKYTTREGVALSGLNVKAFSTFNPTVACGEDITNNSGEWELFVDPGMYLLKVQGESLLEDFDQTFRLKVGPSGELSFENITKNVATPNIDFSLQGNENGNGTEEISDIVTDANGNPIIDVQVSVYYKNNLSKIIAQDYTDVGGKWIVFLDPGSYVIEFYHPEFHEFREDRQVN